MNSLNEQLDKSNEENKKNLNKLGKRIGGTDDRLNLIIRKLKEQNETFLSMFKEHSVRMETYDYERKSTILMFGLGGFVVVVIGLRSGCCNGKAKAKTRHTNRGQYC